MRLVRTLALVLVPRCCSPCSRSPDPARCPRRRCRPRSTAPTALALTTRARARLRRTVCPARSRPRGQRDWFRDEARALRARSSRRTLARGGPRASAASSSVISPPSSRERSTRRSSSLPIATTRPERRRERQRQRHGGAGRARARRTRAPGRRESARTPLHTLVFLSSDGRGAYGGLGAARFAATSPLARRAVAVVSLDGLAGRATRGSSSAGSTAARRRPRSCGPPRHGRRRDRHARRDSPGSHAARLARRCPSATASRRRSSARGVPRCGSRPRRTAGRAPAATSPKGSTGGGSSSSAGPRSRSSARSTAPWSSRPRPTARSSSATASSAAGRSQLLLARGASCPFLAGAVDLLARCRRRQLPLAAGWRALRRRLGLWLVLVVLARRSPRSRARFPREPRLAAAAGRAAGRLVARRRRGRVLVVVVLVWLRARARPRAPRPRDARTRSSRRTRSRSSRCCSSRARDGARLARTASSSSLPSLYAWLSCRSSGARRVGTDVVFGARARSAPCSRSSCSREQLDLGLRTPLYAARSLTTGVVPWTATLALRRAGRAVAEPRRRDRAPGATPAGLRAVVRAAGSGRSRPPRARRRRAGCARARRRRPPGRSCATPGPSSGRGRRAAVRRARAARAGSRRARRRRAVRRRARRPEPRRRVARALERATAPAARRARADERRDGVARQAEHERRAADAEREWLAGPHRDAPEHLLDAELARAIAPHEVVRADRDAARGDERRPPRAPRASAARCALVVVGDSRRARSTIGARAREQRREHDAVRLVDLARPELLAGRAELGSGVRIATRGRRAQRGSATPAGGERREPGRREQRPGREDARRPPRRRPRAGGCSRRTGRRSAIDDRLACSSVTRSIGTTASAPSGTTPPVAIPIASPAPSARARGRARRRSLPTTGSLPGVSAARSAKPSIAELGKRRQVDRGAATSSARTRPAASASGTSSAGSGRARSSTRASASSTVSELAPRALTVHTGYPRGVISVVVPVHDEERSVALLYEELAAALDGAASRGRPSSSTTARATERSPRSCGSTTGTTTCASSACAATSARRRRSTPASREAEGDDRRDDRRRPPGRPGRDPAPARQARRGLRPRLGLEDEAARPDHAQAPLARSSTPSPAGSRACGSTT